MTVLAGVVVIALSLLCWGGQVISWFASDTAVKYGLSEAESEVETAFWADGRGEAFWDTFVLWPMVVAGVLLVADQSAWAYFGLVGSAMYVYFTGRGIATRLAMQRRGLRIGSPASVRMGFTFLAVWGVMAVVVGIAAIGSLEAS